MIHQFVNVNQTMLVTHFKAVDENVNLQETVLNLKNANDSNVYLYAEKEVRLISNSKYYEYSSLYSEYNSI